MPRKVLRVSPAVLLQRVNEWLDQKDLRGDAKTLTKQEWKERGEQNGNRSAGVLLIESSPLFQLLNYGEDGWKKMEEFTDFLRKLGYYYEMVFAWAVAFYPL
jgi:hypothetical protein